MNYFDTVVVPGHWRYVGINNAREEGDEENTTLSCGVVFLDMEKNISLRLCFLLSSERYVLVEKREGRKINYKTVCNFRADEVEKLNEFILKNY